MKYKRVIHFPLTVFQRFLAIIYEAATVKLRDFFLKLMIQIFRNHKVNNGRKLNFILTAPSIL